MGCEFRRLDSRDCALSCLDTSTHRHACKTKNNLECCQQLLEIVPAKREAIRSCRVWAEFGSGLGFGVERSVLGFEVWIGGWAFRLGIHGASQKKMPKTGMTWRSTGK